MEVTKFDIEIKYKNRTLSAICEMFQVQNYPQIWVAVAGRGKYRECFTLYEVNWESRKYYWFKLPDRREELVKVIANALEEYISLPAQTSK